MGGTETVLVTVSIDTECDHDPHWVRADPLSFESINRGLPERLQPVFIELGAVPTYLLTVEVMEDKASVDTLRSLTGRHELGTHLHAAFIEPQKKFHYYGGVDSPDFQCAYPPDIEYAKLSNLTTLFRDCFGYMPHSFRAGRYGASANSLNSLQKLGYKVDSSVTPHMSWHEPNASVNFKQAPEQPYIPASDSIARSAETAAAGRILEVPVTVKPRLFRDPRWFRPWFASVKQMKDIVHYHLKKYRRKPVVVINMMFHSMEVIEKASPYPQTTEQVQRYVDDMQNVLQWCADEGFQFVGLSDVYEHIVRTQVN
ncbi:MAG: hypothetical protein KTR32_26795 [Granulosicoccus sp.]|nr:hypothetical protein [Granulosicoccus sp.]